jgi:hypothetical protein
MDCLKAVFYGNSFKSPLTKEPVESKTESLAVDLRGLKAIKV